jgi:hypothetical protein
MIPNNQPSSLSLRPEGFTTPAPPRGAAPWPTATQRLFFSNPGELITADSISLL